MLLGQRSSRRFRIWWLQAFAPSSLWPPPARHYLSRRISKSSAGVITHYLYDDWNLIAEYTGTVLEKTYTWGMDLSGSMQGTGGVGGLLAVSEFTTQNSQVTIQNYYPTYDGNGNVSEYLDSAGLVVAHFEYDPFGNTTVNTDTAGLFDILFSTKKKDLATGLYYYGYRYYDPVTGRWPSRDPIGERGGVNLYGMVGNDAVGRLDYLGLCSSCPAEYISANGCSSLNWGVYAGHCGEGEDRGDDENNTTGAEFFNDFMGENEGGFDAVILATCGGQFLNGLLGENAIPGMEMDDFNIGNFTDEHAAQIPGMVDLPEGVGPPQAGDLQYMGIGASDISSLLAMSFKAAEEECKNNNCLKEVTILLTCDESTNESIEDARKHGMWGVFVAPHPGYVKRVGMENPCGQRFTVSCNNPLCED